MTTIDTSEFRALLEHERAKIQSAIDHLHQEHPGNLEDELGEVGGRGSDNHMGDVATVTFDRELDYTLEENSEQLLAAIDAALKRIEDGTYGTCARCGKPIPEDRLEAKPYASLCIEHQRELERG